MGTLMKVSCEGVLPGTYSAWLEIPINQNQIMNTGLCNQMNHVWRHVAATVFLACSDGEREENDAKKTQVAS